MLPLVGIEPGSPFYINLTFAWKTETLGSLVSHALLIPLKSTKSKFQVVHEQKFKLWTHQAAAAVAASRSIGKHCDASKSTPSPFSKRQVERQNFKAAADATARSVHTLEDLLSSKCQVSVERSM